MSREKKLFELSKELAVRCGKISLPYYGKIASMEKHFHAEGKVHTSPVTAIDFGLQEIILAELMRNGFEGEVGFNGEEDTPLRFFFPLEVEGGITLHCDPIDGTHSFAKGDGRYAVGIGLSKLKKGKHHFFASAIYLPLSQELFWSFHERNSHHSQRKDSPPILYAWKVFNPKGEKAVHDAGYQLGNAGNTHAGVVDVALGKSAGLVHRNVEIHDAFVPLAFARNLEVNPWIDGAIEKGDLSLHASGGKFARFKKVGYFSDKKATRELAPIFENPDYINPRFVP